MLPAVLHNTIGATTKPKGTINNLLQQPDEF
jgi:hypothetical protein